MFHDEDTRVRTAAAGNTNLPPKLLDRLAADNRLVNRLLVRDQEARGSNPLSPTKLFIFKNLANRLVSVSRSLSNAPLLFGSRPDE